MKKLLLLTPSLFLVACLGQNDSALKNESQDSASNQQVLSKTAPRLAVTVSEQRHPDVQKVVVNVRQIEVHFTKKERSVRYLLGLQLGQVDLLDLGQGLALELSQFSLPAGSAIKHIRMVLEDSGNYLEMKDGSVCTLQTPSAQQSGLKINNLKAHQFEAGKDYALDINFDTEKGLVFQGNGGCLLKPVLRFGGLVEIVPDVEDPVVVIPDDSTNPEVPDDSSDPEVPDDSTGSDPGDGSNGDDGTGGSSEDPTNPGDDTTGGDSSTGDSGTGSDDGSTGSGDDTTGDEYWDYTPIVDGVPTIIP